MFSKKTPGKSKASASDIKVNKQYLMYFYHQEVIPIILRNILEISCKIFELFHRKALYKYLLLLYNRIQEFIVPIIFFNIFGM